jgi:hypothetical protein
MTLHGQAQAYVAIDIMCTGTLCQLIPIACGLQKINSEVPSLFWDSGHEVPCKVA